MLSIWSPVQCCTDAPYCSLAAPALFKLFTNKATYLNPAQWCMNHIKQPLVCNSANIVLDVIANVFQCLHLATGDKCWLLYVQEITAWFIFHVAEC